MMDLTMTPDAKKQLTAGCIKEQIAVGFNKDGYVAYIAFIPGTDSYQELVRLSYKQARETAMFILEKLAEMGVKE